MGVGVGFEVEFCVVGAPVAFGAEVEIVGAVDAFVADSLDHFIVSEGGSITRMNKQMLDNIGVSSGVAITGRKLGAYLRILQVTKLPGFQRFQALG